MSRKGASSHFKNIIVPERAFPYVRPADLRADLEKIKTEGLAISRGDYVPDAVGIAAPVFNADGEVCASIGIISPEMRIPSDEHFQNLQDNVKRYAAELSYDLGYMPRKK